MNREERVVLGVSGDLSKLSLTSAVRGEAYKVSV